MVFKLLDYLSAKNKRMEKVINLEVIELVKDGKILEEGMIKARLGGGTNRNPASIFQNFHQFIKIKM